MPRIFANFLIGEHNEEMKVSVATICFLLFSSLLLSQVEPAGTFNRITVVDSVYSDYFEVEFEGSGILNPPRNQYVNSYYFYDAAINEEYTILFIKNFEIGVDRIRLIGGHIVVREQYCDEVLLVVKMTGGYRAFGLYDLGKLDMKITCVSDVYFHGIHYHCRIPLCSADTYVINGGSLGVNQYTVKINVATDVGVSIGDSHPTSRSWVYPEYFNHNIYKDPLDYTKWTLEMS